MLVGVGAVSGFGSGLSGAGGPLFSVPIMVLAGFVPLAAVGTSQVLQIVAAAFGTRGQPRLRPRSTSAWRRGSRCSSSPAWLAGVRLAHAVSVGTLRRLAAACASSSARSCYGATCSGLHRRRGGASRDAARVRAVRLLVHGALRDRGRRRARVPRPAADAEPVDARARTDRVHAAAASGRHGVHRRDGLVSRARTGTGCSPGGGRTSRSSRRRRGEAGVALRDLSGANAVLAVQGPESARVLERHLGAAPGVAYFGFREAKLAGVPVTIGRLGYSGELGYELIVPERTLRRRLWRDARGGRARVRLRRREQPADRIGLHPVHERAGAAGQPVRARARAVGVVRRAGVHRERGAARAALARARPAPRRARRRSRAAMPSSLGELPRVEVTSRVRSPTFGGELALGFAPAEAAAPGTLVSTSDTEVGARSAGCRSSTRDACCRGDPREAPGATEAWPRTWHFWFNRSVHDNPGRFPLSTDTPESSRKAQIDALLLKLPGVSARKINGLDAYFVSDKMFACISSGGVGTAPAGRHRDRAAVFQGQRRPVSARRHDEFEGMDPDRPRRRGRVREGSRAVPGFARLRERRPDPLGRRRRDRLIRRAGGNGLPCAPGRHQDP